MERLPLPPTHPDGQRAQAVLCLSTKDSPGCNHPVDWHTGSGTPAPNCDCCSWRKNVPTGRLVTGPLGLPIWKEDQA